MKYYHIEMSYKEGVFENDEWEKQHHEFLEEYIDNEVYPEGWIISIPFYYISEDQLLMIRLKYSLSENFLKCEEAI